MTKEPQGQVFSPILWVNKEDAALRQLESAILLWFQTQEAVSIHTLSVAAHDCYVAMDKKDGQNAPSMWEKWFNQQSASIRDAIRHPQNFFKHGRKDLKGKSVFTPLHAELFIFECASIHERIYESMTPLMLAFALRFVSENPKIVKGRQRARVREILDGYSIEGINVDDLVKLNRREFLQAIAPSLEKLGVTSRIVAHKLP